MAANSWRNVTPDEPCIVCKHGDWCRIGTKRVHCMRVESDKPAKSVGWYHALDGTTPATEPPPGPEKPRPTDVQLHSQFAPQAVRWHASGLSCGKTQELAALLGVSLPSLSSIGCGWNGHEWTLPERTPAGLIVGIGTRKPSGEKKCLPGSRRALTYSATWHDGTGPVFVVEGPSDVAAGIVLGLRVVGRPSNRGGGEMLAELLRDEGDVIIMGENDQKPDGRWPGKEGAEAVAGALRKMLTGKVRIRYPLDGAKDLRGWLNATRVKADDDEARLKLGAAILRRMIHDKKKKAKP